MTEVADGNEEAIEGVLRNAHSAYEEYKRGYADVTFRRLHKHIADLRDVTTDE